MGKLREDLEAYKNVIERALAGFIRAKDNASLTKEDVQEARKIIQSLPDFSDYLELTFALDKGDYDAVRQIVGKANVKVESAENDPDRLQRAVDELFKAWADEEGMYSKFHRAVTWSTALTEIANEFGVSVEDLAKAYHKMVFPLDRTDEDVLYEDYICAFEVPDSNSMAELIKYLENNKLKYTKPDATHIQVTCPDRNDEYKLDRYVSKQKKKIFRDDIAEEEMNEGKRKKGVKNPAAAALRQKQFQPKVVPGKKEQEAKKDPWSRDAKHKKPIEESALSEQFNVGQKVRYADYEATVKIPRGPNGTVGLLIDGELKMVNEGDVARLDEGVLGMTIMPPINRLRKLAGMKTEDVMPEPPVDSSPLDAGPVDMEVEPGMDLPPPADVPPPAPVSEPMPSAGLPPEPMPAPMPGPAAPMPMGAGTSSEYNHAVEMLGQIQKTVSEMKLSEYKMFCSQLQNFVSQVKMTGHAFLGEAKKADKKNVDKEDKKEKKEEVDEAKKKDKADVDKEEEKKDKKEKK